MKTLLLIIFLNVGCSKFSITPPDIKPDQCDKKSMHFYYRQCMEKATEVGQFEKCKKEAKKLYCKEKYMGR